MSTANKYHASGRLYTSMELRQRRYAMVKTYVVLGYWGRKQVGADGLPVPEVKVLPHKRTEPRRHEDR